MSKLLAPQPSSWRLSGGLLAVRLVVGSAFIHHGWNKIQKPFEWAGDRYPAFLQALAAFSEVGGGAALILGLLVPVASVGLLCTMAVAAYSHMAKGDPFVGRPSSYELAAVFLSVSVLMLLQGPGRMSVDAVLFGRANSTADKK
jgi:putative oxidoreductase